jgi:tetratricopeptide (TPR) repeat protein
MQGALHGQESVLRAVSDAAQGGDHERAAALAQAALASGLEHPLLFNLAAFALERRGQVAEAEQLLRRAVEMAPGDIGSRNALGLCLLRLDRPAEALEVFDLLLATAPDAAFLHVSRGNSLRALGAIQQAEASYHRALAIDPEHGIALAGLANIASSRGAYRDARNWADKALTRIPGYPDAVMSLAAAELGEQQSDRAERRLRALLDDTRLSSSERAYANGLLGDVLDAQDRPAEAFAAYTQCNDALRSVYADRFSEGAALAYARALTRYFERAGPAWTSPSPPPEGPPHANGHVFLLGFPRSGTTLLEVILEGHPDVVSLEEQESLIAGVREFMRDPQDLERLSRATPAVLESFRASYWQHVARAGIDVAGKLFLDKHPLNTLKLPLIARLFPDAKIIVACRDPRDVVLSCFRHRFQLSAPLYELLSLEGAARYYDAVMGLLVRLTSLLPLETCLVRHEDVVTAFRREMKRICTFIGIEWVSSMGEFAPRTQNRDVLTPSTAQLVRGLNTEGLGQWRRYRPHLEPVLAQLDPWVRQFLYAD